LRDVGKQVKFIELAGLIFNESKSPDQVRH